MRKGNWAQLSSVVTESPWLGTFYRLEALGLDYHRLCYASPGVARFWTFRGSHPGLSPRKRGTQGQEAAIVVPICSVDVLSLQDRL